MTHAPQISLVAPVYRNASTLGDLARRVGEAFAGQSYELILVDDASPDASLRVAEELAETDEAARVVALPENVGQNAALLEGFAAASGDWVIALDADLQDPPEALPDLLDLARRQELDVVFAGRRGRYQGRTRMLSSWLYKRTLHLLCGLPPDAGLCFVASRRLVDALLARRSDTWVLPMIGLSGRSVASVPVQRAVRAEGTSAYSGWDRLGVALPPIVYALRRLCLQRRIIEALACSLLALVVYLAFAFEPPFQLSDEGFRYLLSRSSARGDSLFDRYMVLYPTGQYAYFGAWMKLLGEELWVLRLARAFLGGGIALFMFSAVARVATPMAAWFTVLACALAVPPQAKGLAMAVVVFLAVRLADEVVPPRLPFWSALSAGALAGWREDSAVLAFAVAVAAVVLRRQPRQSLALPVVAAAGFLPWWLLEAGRGDGFAFVHHVVFRLRFLVERLAEPTDVSWTWPPQAPTSLRQALSQSMPLLAALPIIVYGALLWHQAWRRRTDRPVQRASLVVAGLGFAYLPQFVLERPDLSHFIYHLPVLLLAVATLSTAMLPERRRRWAGSVPALLCVALVVGSASSIKRQKAIYPGPGGLRYGLETEGHPPWASLDRRPGETLIVLGWGPGWYAAEDLEPGTRFLSTFLRHVGTPERQAELVQDLRRPSNRWVIQTGYEMPDSAREAVRDGYCRVGGRWRNAKLWQRCNGGRPDDRRPVDR